MNAEHMTMLDLLKLKQAEREAERRHCRDLHVALLAALDQHGPLTIKLNEHVVDDDRKIYFERLPDAPETIRVTASPKP